MQLRRGMSIAETRVPGHYYALAARYTKYDKVSTSSPHWAPSKRLACMSSKIGNRTQQASLAVVWPVAQVTRLLRLGAPVEIISLAIIHNRSTCHLPSATVAPRAKTRAESLAKAIARELTGCLRVKCLRICLFYTS